MHIYFKDYTEEYLDQWDFFVRNQSRNGSIFHEQRFLSYHPKERFNRYDKICFNQKNEIIAVIPGVLVTEGISKKYVSHLGSTAGGIVYSLYATTREVLAILDGFLLLLKEISVESVEFRIHEPFFSFPHHGELEYALWFTGFQNTSKELSTVYQLFDENLNFISKRTLSYIRSLEKKGFLVNSDDDINDTYTLISSNLEKRYQKKPTHSLDELVYLKKVYSNRIHIWTVRHPLSFKILSAIVVFEATDKAVHDFYIAQDYDDPNSSHTLNLLFYKAFSFYKEKGFAFYNFGISSRKKDIKWGILEFKEKAGGRAISRDVWVLSNLIDYTSVNQINNNG